MTSRRIALLVCAVAALLLLAWLVEVELPRREQARSDARELLAPVDAKLTGLRIVRRSAGVERDMRFRPRGDGAWLLDARGIDSELVADIRAIEDIERALAGARIGATVIEDVATIDDAEPFGIRPPLVELTWRTEAGGERRLDLGRIAPGGSVYAVTPDGALALAPRAVFEAVKWDVDHYRLKRVLPGDWTDATRLVIERPRDPPPPVSPRLVFERDAETPTDWRLVEPSPSDAADGQLDALTSKLRSLMATGFGTEHPSRAELEEKGLSPPWARVEVTHAANEPPYSLLVGELADDENKVWARAGDGPLVLVRADVRDDLVLPDIAFRENRVVPLARWHVTDLEIDKPGRLQTLDLKLTRDADGWRVAAPVDVRTSAKDVESLLVALADAHLGRFEDAHAEAPSSHPNGDFDAPGSFEIRAIARPQDVGALRIRLRVAPPFRGPDGELFALAAVEDGRGRTTLGVMKAKALDEFFTQARALRDEAWERAAAEPARRP